MEDASTNQSAVAEDESLQTATKGDGGDSVADSAEEVDAPSPLFSSDHARSVPPSGGLESSTNRQSTDAAAPSRPESSGRSVRFSLNEEEKQQENASNLQEPELDVLDQEQPTLHQNTLDSRYSKERTANTDMTIGATQVDERAPNINLRFFRGLAARNRRGSQRSRNREDRARRREVQQQDQQVNDSSRSQMESLPEEMVASVRPMSNIMLEQQAGRSQTASRRFGASLLSSLSHSRFFNSSDVLINATLVEEEDLEYAVAEEMNWWQKYAKILLPALCLVLIALSGSVTYGALRQRDIFEPSEMPSSMPSLMPSQDIRPTIINVQERGYLRCGINLEDTPELNFRKELCRAVAAVVLGNPDSYEGIDPSSFGDRWSGLQKGGIDLQLTGDTHNVQREVELEFSFSTPYFYDGASFNGNATFVQCAYRQKRYDECRDLIICYPEGTAGIYIKEHFSPDFYKSADSWTDVFEMYNNGDCNVIAGDRQAAAAQMGAANLTDEYIIGNTTFTNEPLAIVTRNDESEWVDVTTWVMRALFYGEKQGIVQNDTLCDDDIPVTDAAQLNYLNAVHCVGNYEEVFTRSFGSSPSSRNDINRINSGSAMLYLTPFGNINDVSGENEPQQVAESEVMAELWHRNLRCGVVVRKGCEDDNITASNDICGIGIDMCAALTSSIFYGKADAVNFTIYDDEASALSGLANKSIDVLVGLQDNFENDFGGATFTMPYYYDNTTGEDDGVVYSMATRDDEAIFASYVNCILLATIHAAAEGVTQEYSTDMPTMTLFGKRYLWALKDAISAAGNYDEMYFRNFGDVLEEDRGRNALNELQTPQLFYNPGL